MIRLNGIIEAFKRYGFVILSDEQKELIDYLKTIGVIHMLNIRKLSKHTILELNIYGCEKECELRCRDGNGVININCFGECADSCIIEKLDIIVKILTRSSM